MCRKRRNGGRGRGGPDLARDDDVADLRGARAVHDHLVHHHRRVRGRATGGGVGGGKGRGVVRRRLGDGRIRLAAVGGAPGVAARVAGRGESAGRLGGVGRDEWVEFLDDGGAAGELVGRGGGGGCCSGSGWCGGGCPAGPAGFSAGRIGR